MQILRFTDKYAFNTFATQIQVFSLLFRMVEALRFLWTGAKVSSCFYSSVCAQNLDSCTS